MNLKEVPEFKWKMRTKDVDLQGLEKKWLTKVFGIHIDEYELNVFNVMKETI